MDSHPDRVEILEQVLALARQQGDGVARGDLKTVAALQERRGSLPVRLPSAAEGNEQERRLADEIRDVDRRILCLLALKRDAIREEIHTVVTLKKMLCPRRESSDPVPGRFACRA